MRTVEQLQAAVDKEQQVSSRRLKQAGAAEQHAAGLAAELVSAQEALEAHPIVKEGPKIYGAQIYHVNLSHVHCDLVLVQLVLDPFYYSLTYLAYSSNGTPNFLAIATWLGESLTVRRALFTPEDLEAGATVCTGRFVLVFTLNCVGNASRNLLFSSS